MGSPPVPAGVAPFSAGWPGLDFVRFLCAVFMVLVHAFFWLATSDGRMLLDPDSLVVRVIPVGMIAGFFPLMLPFTAGCSLRLSLGWKAALPVLPWRAVGRMIGTGALVAALGFALNYIASGIHVLLTWNVLQTVGLGIACTALLVRRGSIWPLAIAGLLSVLGGPLLRAWLIMPPVAAGGAAVLPGQGALWAASDWYVTKALVGDPTAFHVWPFVPWFGTVVAGFLFAQVYLAAGRGGAAFRWGMPAIGTALIVAAGWAGELVPRFSGDDLIGPALFLASPAFVGGLVGIAICLISIATVLFAGQRFSPAGVISCLSRGVLWVYLAHTLVGGWLATWVLSTYDRADVFRRPFVPMHLVLLVGVPATLLAVGWLAGWMAVRWLDGRRVRITFRKVGRPASGPA